MTKKEYKKAETFLLAHKEPGLADCLHSYRVLYLALQIAEKEKMVDKDVLILACLLHDVGRATAGSETPHAAVGAKMAYRFLRENGWDEKVADYVKNCIRTHSRKSTEKPESKEAKILYDADKLDLTGVSGYIRLTALGALEEEPMYTVDPKGSPLPGKSEEAVSLFRRMNRAKKRGASYYTKEGRRLGAERQKEGNRLFGELKKEIKNTSKNGIKILDKTLKKEK